VTHGGTPLRCCRRGEHRWRRRCSAGCASSCWSARAVPAPAAGSPGPGGCPRGW
jgi:hypothetical protein